MNDLDLDIVYLKRIERALGEHGEEELALYVHELLVEKMGEKIESLSARKQAIDKEIEGLRTLIEEDPDE